MVIVDMVFNLGIQKFKGFKRAIAAIEAEDWSMAATELQNSVWYSQVGARAREDTRIMSEVP
jgi:lysozyme